MLLLQFSIEIFNPKSLDDFKKLLKLHPDILIKFIEKKITKIIVKFIIIVFFLNIYLRGFSVTIG